MAQVTNMSDRALSVAERIGDGPRVFSQFFPPRMKHVPGSVLEEVDPLSEASVPDEIMKAWAKKPTNANLVASRSVVIEYGDAPARAPARAPAVAPDETPLAETGPAAGEPREHYMKTIARIKTIEKVDTLETMYAVEDRPKVREALEARIGEIA